MKKNLDYEAVCLKTSLTKILRVMKFTLLLILFTTVQLFATVYSQTTRLSINMKNATLADIFEEIEEKSEFRFLYNHEMIKNESFPYVNCNGKTIREILDQVLEGTGNSYSILENNLIVITPTGVQQRSGVKGKVINISGEPVPGVTVLVRGTTNGTITDVNGNFSFSNIPSDGILVFSFVGMKTQEIPVSGKTVMNVTLEEEAIGIGEVVAIGYGTIKKVNLTGSVAVASKEIFENKSVPNTIAAIQGTIPGVTVTRNSGKPGSEGYNIQIRGASSVNSVGVLVIVDGVAGQSLGELNPNDIESISVLKDAAAAAIYGSNAAGGVMLVTTKKGKAGKTVVEYSGMYGVTSVARIPHPLDDSYTEFNMLNIANRNSGNFSGVFDDEVKMAWFKGERLDEPDKYGGYVVSYPTGLFFVDPTRPNVWQSANSIDPLKEFLNRDNPVQSHNVSVRGGTDKNTFFLSTGYYNRRGMLKYGPDSNERYHVRLTVNNELHKHVSLNTSVAFRNSNVYQPSYGAETLVRRIFKSWPNNVTYGPTGEYFAGHGLWPSYVQEMKEGGELTQHYYSFDGKADLIVKDILPGLEVNVVGSKSFDVQKQLITRRTLTYIGPQGTPTLVVNNPNSMSKDNYFSDYSSFQAFATYNFNIKKSHHFTFLGGYSYEDYRDETVSAGAKTLVTNDFFSLSWGDANTKTNSDEIITWATMAVFGRLNYNFKEKYLFEANLRYDASSRLAPSTRWNAFPSLSAGWNIGKENFFQGVKAIEDLKLRVSWGQLGNSNALGYYDYIGLLNANSSLPFNGAPTQYIYQNKLASPTKTWETVETSNIGIDFVTFNGKLSVSADAYIKKNKNMLASMEVPSIIGVGLPSYNVGELETRGWDLQLSWKEMTGKFKYWVSINLSDNTNKLIRYEGRNIIVEGVNRLIEGMPLNTLWGYKTDGLFQSNQEYADYGVFIDPKTGEGDMKYLDLKADKKINAGSGTPEDHGDLVRLGDTNPRYLFGINLGFRWKGFDFNSFFQGVGKRKFFLNNSFLMPIQATEYSPIKEQLDYWTTENRDAFWPRLYTGGMQSYKPSDYWIQDAAYIRLKNIEIGYTFPQAFTQKACLSKARLFISGQDLWETTKAFSFVDPEFPNDAGFVYPFYRSISLGLNITF
jgi:TonB-linked SusC/RagA family outer membrane protein